MVWALRMPDSFGVFWPHGTYVGYDEQLEACFNAMPDDFKAKFGNRLATYSHYATMKWTYEQGRVVDNKPPIVPLEPHEKPNWFETIKPYKNLGSLIDTMNRLKLVDEDLKNIIEGLEPGVHQFWPISITFPKGAVYPKQYYGIAIGRFLDCYAPEQTVGEPWPDGTYFSKQAVNGLAFSKAAVGTAHLWKERRLRIATMYFSDALMAEIHKAGLRLPKHFQAREV
jgi:hypothetical protein